MDFIQEVNEALDLLDDLGIKEVRTHVEYVEDENGDIYERESWDVQFKGWSLTTPKDRKD